MKEVNSRQPKEIPCKLRARCLGKCPSGDLITRRSPVRIQPPLSAGDDGDSTAVDGTDAGSTAGDAAGEGWDEAGGSNAGQLVELFLGRNGSGIAAGETLNLGNAFNTSVFGAGNGDLVFTFGLLGGGQFTAPVNYITGPAGVQGDYNNNGTVDAADYVLWRRGGPLQNEGVTPGQATASHVVLGLAALSGVVALVAIWRH